MTMLAIPVVIAAVAMVRTSMLHRRVAQTGCSGVSARQQWSFWLGVAAIDLAVGGATNPALAEHPATAHVAQFVMIALVGVPLLLMSLPEWWVRRQLATIRGYRLARRISHPLVAGSLGNAIVLTTLAPASLGVPGADVAASTALVIAWIVGGVVLWLPLLTPLPEHRLGSVAMRCAYLFGAAGLTPMLPGELLVSSSGDDRLAGLLLYLAAAPLVWAVIAAMWLGSMRRDRVAGAVRAAHPSAARP